MNTKFLLSIIGLLLFLTILCSCSSQSEAYIGYLDRVSAILGDSGIDTSKKGPAILDYVEKNRTGIDKCLEALESMNAKQAEAVADKVQSKINDLVVSIQAMAQSSPEIASDPALLSALSILKVISA